MEALQQHLVAMVQVRLRQNTCNQDVAEAVKAVLSDTSAHLLSYLLDYFLLQLQTTEWAMPKPYTVSARVHEMTRGDT